MTGRLFFSLALTGSLCSLAVPGPIARADNSRGREPEETTVTIVPRYGNTDPSQPSDEERRFVTLINQERAQRGLSELTFDPLLMDVARKHSAEMRDRGYFSHESPTPGQRTVLDRYMKAASRPSGYVCVGENLFYGMRMDAYRGHNYLMASQSHRENLLSSRFEKVGVGVIRNERGEVWVTQVFLSRSRSGRSTRVTSAER